MHAKYYTRPNHEEECWELMERDGAATSEGQEDSILAKFYDGDARGSLTAEEVALTLNSRVHQEFRMIHVDRWPAKIDPEPDREPGDIWLPER